MEITAALSGVEITEESRYIDHTNATPFEEHCAEIQDYLTNATVTTASKKCIIYHCAGQSMATVMEYVGTKKVEGGNGRNDDGEVEDIVGHVFPVKQYIAVVATEDDMYTFTPSMKSYVFSTLITAAAATSAASWSSFPRTGGDDSADSAIHRNLAIFFLWKV